VILKGRIMQDVVFPISPVYVELAALFCLDRFYRFRGFEQLSKQDVEIITSYWPSHIRPPPVD